MFNTNRFAMFLLVLFSFTLSSLTLAQDKKPNEQNKGKQETQKVSAKTIDFKAQLGSSTYALDQLGNMIEDGRQYFDVNSLLSASMILFVEEKTTGKKAQITGMDLLSEATELAKKQKSSSALNLCADVWSNPLFGNNGKTGKELAELSKSFEAELASTRGPGAKVVDVRVENYTDYTLYVYIDGVYKGAISPGYYVVYNNIGSGWTDFYAKTGDIWSYSQGKYIYYYWNNSYNLTNYDYTYKTDFTWSVY